MVRACRAIKRTKDFHMVSDVNFLVDLLQKAMETNTKLFYLKGRGKGEIVRLTLAAAGEEFEDVFITEPEQLEKLQDDGNLLFMQIPLLEIDGLKLVQSGAIVRYLAHKHNMMGKSLEEQAMVNTLFEGSRDFFQLGVTSRFFMTTEKANQAVDNIKNKAKDRYLPIFEKIYKKSPSGFLVGDSLTLADIGWLEVLLWLHELEPQFAISFPSVAVFTNKISSLPNMNAFLNGPQRQPQPDATYIATVRKVLNWY